ncbi:Anaerobic dimethyl sulfoxide reductase chain B [Caulifigura coniformis]|uniref:Anaerobic dimethyl sulfoxide reductase chain B n=1 Tax=Caulifigura coniformis TaxID=2527983 RepID=A0A517SJ52_9PLAN|nr:DmsC/YnfH family molybdoenzyme membrane anchor subunit [Caulifigura coniformis]QDT56163.1 Anaerobic dimethyl sulfoxide reductase chain B [Caulifigura coniformis]
MTTTRLLTLDDLSNGLKGAGDATVSLLDQLLAEQHDLTAVEAFSRDHASCTGPAQAKYYSRLLPAAPPGPGEQYAFEVDLDRCSGCKACVTACHSLNGLDEQETWRDVGLLMGGTEQLPVIQHVTAACHHCVEPACMIACPVNAYEKDPLTGIVKHLDDQCFGCQYCTLACPYNVPKYHAQKGIVRKCDMCSSRLKTGEAPACVQACPHEAISIRVVSTERVREDSETNRFLPAAPDPAITLPTTLYRSTRVFPRNTLPADYHALSPEHPHWPLIVMLVLTQLSVGTFIVGVLLDETLPATLAAVLRPFQATGALVLGLLALGASTCHLGRPLLAFRGILGLRHSWLSREIVAFGLFAGLAVPYAAACWIASPGRPLGPRWAEQASALLPALGMTVAATGALGVFCSGMIYVFTRRELWSFERTMARFAMTSALLGIATAWLSLLLVSRSVDSEIARELLTAAGPQLTRGLMLATGLKLVFDLLILKSLADLRLTSLRRTALLVTGVLSPIALARIGAGILGGIALPMLVLNALPDAARPDLTITVSMAVAWMACLAGELLERYLFFAAVAAPRMPGGIRS